MANDQTKSPHILDTAANPWTEKIYIKSIRWVSKGGVAGDDLVLQDGSARNIWEGVAPGANHSEEAIIERWFNGYDLTVIDNGKLYITFGEE